MGGDSQGSVLYQLMLLSATGANIYRETFKALFSQAFMRNLSLFGIPVWDYTAKCTFLFE